MPKSPPPAPRGGSRRAAPTKVAKPFPWGTVVGSALLALVLGGILVFAALNPGSGRDQLLTDPDNAIKGVAVATGKLSRGHVAGPVKYPQTPPNTGDHNASPQTCAVYTAPIASEHAVHSLEHGAVWITYNAKVPAAQVEALAAKVKGNDYRLMSPAPAQSSPVDLSAWGRRLSVDSASDPRVDDFLRAYTNGPQSPERGARCAGTTTTGPLRPGGPDGALLSPAPLPPAGAPSAPAGSPAASPAAR